MDIFIINTDKADSVPTELLNKFGYKNFSNDKKNVIHKFTYLMLDRILKEFYKIQNYSLVFEKNKPMLSTNEKYFSISHSGEYIVLAFSDHKCGVDIEKIKTRNYTKIAARKGFKSASLKEFYFDWTKYEAEYKLCVKSKTSFQYEFPEYVLTAVSINQDETTEIYYNL